MASLTTAGRSGEKLGSAAGASHLSRAFRRLLRKKIAMAMIIALVVVYTGGIFAE